MVPQDIRMTTNFLVSTYLIITTYKSYNKIKKYFGFTPVCSSVKLHVQKSLTNLYLVTLHAAQHLSHMCVTHITSRSIFFAFILHILFFAYSVCLVINSPFLSTPQFICYLLTKKLIMKIPVSPLWIIFLCLAGCNSCWNTHCAFEA